MHTGWWTTDGQRGLDDEHTVEATWLVSSVRTIYCPMVHPMSLQCTQSRSDRGANMLQMESTMWSLQREWCHHRAFPSTGRRFAPPTVQNGGENVPPTHW